MKTKSRHRKKFNWEEVIASVVLFRRMGVDTVPYYKSQVIVNHIDVFGYHNIIQDRYTVIHMTSGYPIGSFTEERKAKTFVKRLELLTKQSGITTDPYVGRYNPEEDIPF